MKWLIICLTTISLITGSCRNANKTYEKAKENILEDEQKAPLRFLTIEGSNKRNLFGQTVVRATITNTATICSYDKVRIKMLYYNSEGVQVTNHEEVLEKPVEPNEQVKFKAKYFTPKGTDSVALSIMSAEPVKNDK